MSDTYRAYVTGVGWCWMSDGEVIEVIGASSSGAAPADTPNETARAAQRGESSPKGGGSGGEGQ